MDGLADSLNVFCRYLPKRIVLLIPAIGAFAYRSVLKSTRLMLSLCLWAVVASQCLLVTASADETTTATVAADTKTSDAFNWEILEAAHQRALEMIKAATDDFQRRTATFNAVPIMRQAGVAKALDAPLKGFSASRAAAILNDFGFLDGLEPEVQERYLRGAIALDPNRKVAYLNLADLMSARLPLASTSSEKEQRMRKAVDSYRQYLALGGRSTTRIATFLRGEFDKTIPVNLCELAARYANAGRLFELVSDHASGVPTPLGTLDLTFEKQGSAGVPSLEAIETGTGKPVSGSKLERLLPPGTDHLWGGDNLGLLVYHQASYILYYKDLAHPISMKRLTPGDETDACIFSVRTVESYPSTALEPELCERLKSGPETVSPVDRSSDEIPPTLDQVRRAADEARGDVPPTIQFTRKARLTEEQVYAKHDMSSEMASQRVAFLNDGDSYNIGEFELSFSGGPGCEQTFFDVLDSAGTHFKEGYAAQIMNELQGNDVNGNYRTQCQNNPRLFKYKDSVYFEDRPAIWPPADAWDDYHRVARVLQGRITDVCDFSLNSLVTGHAQRSQ